MLYRQHRTSQVKCNFCLEWITLSLDFKSSINVCDECLQKGCQKNTLKAVSSSGKVYQIQFQKELNPLEISSQPKNVSTSSQETQCDIFTEDIPFQEIEHQPEIDSHRNTEIRQILEKWGLISSLFKEKQTLNKEEIFFIKNIISENAINLQKLSAQFQATFLKNTDEWQPVQFQIDPEELSFEQEQENRSKIEKIPEINIKVVEKQNLPLKIKNYQSPLKFKQRQKFKSPNKIAYKIPLQQKNLNTLHVSLKKSPGLKQNTRTPQKRLLTQFYDQNLSLRSSCLQNSNLSLENTSKSSIKSSLFNSTTKKLNQQEIKKFEQARNRISKYLQKNCESNSLGRLMFSVVFQAFSNTSVIGKSLELISYNLSFVDFKCYLEALDWTGIEVLKLVNTKLKDCHLRILIDFINSNDLSIKVMVLTGNKFTEESICYLNEVELNFVKEIYLGKNRIGKWKVRDQIRSLEHRYSLYL